MGANEEIRDSIAGEIAMILAARAQRQSQVDQQPSLPRYKTITIPTSCHPPFWSSRQGPNAIDITTKNEKTTAQGNRW
jgi:hypothetical protein